MSDQLQQEVQNKGNDNRQAEEIVQGREDNV